jgi:trimethylamine---corrinoid protein Co-methyltransferase
MQTEYIYPAVANRMSPKEWAEAGRPDLLAGAIARKARILAQAGSTIDPGLDAQVRAAFDIRFRN